RREVRRKQLDRDRAVERHVAGQEHDPHAASDELALDRIAAGEQLLEGQEFGADRGRHGCSVLRAERRGVSSATTVQRLDPPMLRAWADPSSPLSGVARGPGGEEQPMGWVYGASAAADG